MKEVTLTRGYVAVVDDEDYERIGALKWYAHVHPKNRTTYACRKSRAEGSTSMHRMILDAPPGSLVDHIDGDGLNNRRGNLRLATRRQNQYNRAGRRGGSSRYKGVCWNKITRTWTIDVAGFATEEEAARAYDLVARLAHGEFARLNFPDAA